MEPDLEVVLMNRGDEWVARGRDFEVSGGCLAELEASLRRKLREIGFAPRRSVSVLMVCDRRVIPAWMRPYHSHYFNRVVTLEC
jgi:hypothetical protein